MRFLVMTMILLPSLAAACVTALTGDQAPKRALAPIAQALPIADVENEMRARAERLLDTTPDNPEKGYEVFLAQGYRLPNTMLEIGRLREITFRGVQEGSGQDRDLDRFDPYYYHLICWDKKKKAVTGAYRMGKVDEILKRFGPDGIYSFTFFDFRDLIENEFATRTLELGRSFVVPEYQRGITLSLLWAGIGRFLTRNPRYRHLIGPVSISGAYLDDSKQVMMQFLMENLAHPPANSVTPRQPPRLSTTMSDQDLRRLLDPIDSVTDLEKILRETEGDRQAKIPPLIKLYVEMNVRFLGFNWDEDFNTLDGLIWTDVSQLSAPTLSRYMGEDGARAYLNAQAR